MIGVGNVYWAELLFRHQLDPLQAGCKLPADQWAALWSDLVELIHDGVRRGRIDTIRPEHDPILMGSKPRQDRHGGEVYVYRRAGAPCLGCGAKSSRPGTQDATSIGVLVASAQPAPEDSPL
jgi:endonuclease VIII